MLVFAALALAVSQEIVDVKGKPGLIATYAYTAVPMDPKYGSRAYCGDSSGYVCEVLGAAMPPVVGGVCPKSCKRTE